MIQAASKVPRRAALTERVAAQPERVESGFEVLDRQLELVAGVEVDLVGKDRTGRPFLLLVQDQEDEALVLGRALLVRAEFEHTRGLLRRLYAGRGLRCDDDPRVLLVMRRASDRFRRAVRILGADRFEVADGELIEVEGQLRLILLREGPATTSPTTSPAVKPEAAPAPEPVGSTKDVESRSEALEAKPAAAVSRSETPPENPAMASRGPRNGLMRVRGGPVNAGHGKLLEEAKRRILRIGDEIEEEVDGALIRFLIQDRVLAILARTSDEFSLYIGDEPDRRRFIENLDDLNRGLDDVFRRYFEISRLRHRDSG